MQDYDDIHQELQLFDSALADRPQVVVGNKIDLVESRENRSRVEQEIRKRGIELHVISAATGEGTRELVQAICTALRRCAPAATAPHSMLIEP